MAFRTIEVTEEQAKYLAVILWDNRHDGDKILGYAENEPLIQHVIHVVRQFDGRYDPTKVLRGYNPQCEQ